MQDLTSSDSIHKTAAEGWLELHHHAEARKELEQISESGQGHPDIMELWWLIHAKAENWSACVNLGSSIVEAAPERITGWIDLAHALCKMPDGDVAAAKAILIEAKGKFPLEAIVFYKLACCCARLGEIEAAREFLEESFVLGNHENFRLMALNDSDLKSLLTE